MSKKVFVLLLSLYFLYPAILKKVNLTEGPNYARAIFVLSSKVKIRTGKLRYRDHILLYVDFYGTYPGRIRSRYYYPQGSPVDMIRVSRKDRRRLRVVFYLKKMKKYRIFYLPSPTRLVVDIFFQPLNLPLSRQLGLKIKKIVIDPGHGGKDPGCVNKSLSLEEKYITFSIATTLKELLENDKYQVILTRSNDEFVPLGKRIAIANSEGADLFISIHINWAQTPMARGIETFYLNLATDPEAQRVAAKENETSSKSLSQMKDVLKKIMMNEKIRESKLMAKKVHGTLISTLRKFYPDIKDLGVRGAPFFVLVGAEMPAILVEASFISNPTEAKRLSDPIYRARLSYGIYLGIKEFIKEVEGK